MEDLVSSAHEPSSPANQMMQFQFDYSNCQVNCKEKIVLCIDTSMETENTFLKSKDNKPHSLLSLWKNALELFVWNKSLINSKHEFAIILLEDKEAVWLMDFTSDAKMICEAISALAASSTTTTDVFDISVLFQTIVDKASPPPSTNPTPLLPPDYITRCILLYGRSSTIPVYRGDPQHRQQLISSPYFFLDIIYGHEAPELMSNNCETIFNILAELQPHHKTMVLDIWHNATRMFDHMARLLPHPLQRPPTCDIDHRLLPSNNNHTVVTCDNTEIDH